MEKEKIKLPEILIPKTGTRTSSFKVVIAAWLVGGLMTYIFSFLTGHGYLTEAGSQGMRSYIIEQVAELLPIVWLAGSSWITREYVKWRGAISVAKAETVQQVMLAQVALPPASSSDTQTGEQK